MQVEFGAIGNRCCRNGCGGSRRNTTTMADSDSASVCILSGTETQGDSSVARILAAVCMLAALVLVGSRLAAYDTLGAWSKMIASTSFIGVAFSVGAHRWGYGRVLLAGLFFAWWGDFFLIGSSDTRFLLGLVSFLLGHVMYCVAFVVRGIDVRWSMLTIPMVVAVTGGASWWLGPHVSDEMTGPVRAYTGVISVMVVLAVGARGAGAPWVVPVGAILFYFSDISVAAGQFVKPDFPNYVWGLPFYFGGQVLLAWSGRDDTQ